MRITNHEKSVIIRVLSQYTPETSELRLFGSRTDDQAKGGDFDLLLIIPNDKTREKISFEKAEILSQIKTEIGEQKIDLVITTKQNINNSAFLKFIFPKSVLLKEW